MTEPGLPPRGAVGARVIGGAVLNVAGMIAIRLLSMVNIAILGRLLTPSDFGVVALAMIVVGLVEALTNNQFETALIRQKERDSSHFGTAFAMAFLIGLVSSVIVWLSARPVAMFFDMPELVAPLRWLALAPLLAGLRNPLFVQREIDLDFRAKVSVHVSARVAMTVVAITVAIVLRSYWALIVGTLAMYATHTTMTWAWARAVPRPTLRHWRGFLAFGVWLTGAGALDFLNRRIPAVILGRQSTAVQTGLYQIGSEIATTMTQQLLNPLSHAIFPGLMAISDDRERMKIGYIRIQQSLLGIALPVGVGIALVAPELVRVMLGTQWSATVPVIAILAPVTALSSLTIGVQAVIFIDGDTRGLFLRNLTVFLFLLPAAVLGLSLGGMNGLVGAQAGALLIGTFITLRLGARATDVPILRAFTEARRSFWAVAAMAVALLGVDIALAGQTAANELSFAAAALRLVCKIAFGAAVAGTVQYVSWARAGRPDGFERRMVDLLVGVGKRLR